MSTTSASRLWMREGLVVACAGMKRTDPCVSSGIELPRNSGYSSFCGFAAQAAGVMEGPWPTNPHYTGRTPLDRLARFRLSSIPQWVRFIGHARRVSKQT